MKLFDVYSVFDIELSHAKGSYVWDNQGNRYLDFYGGHAVISVGHSHPVYVERITKQLERIGFYSNSIRIGQQEELADKLGKASGYNDYSLFLCNSGAEANENALKLASFQTGRRKVIAFTGAFHGRTSLAVAATDNPKICAPVNETPNIVFLPLNDITALEQAMGNDVAAVIIEGIQGVAGIVVPNDAFLQKIEELCNRYGALMILDEVQSGYGRTGKFFAHQYAGVQPHLITVAKGMGNGFPVAGVLISPQVEARKEMLGTTFGGNYLACAAAIAVLDIIEQEKLVDNARIAGDAIIQQLGSMDGIVELRGRGLMIGLDAGAQTNVLRSALLSRERVFTGAASKKQTIRLLPSLAVSSAEITEFVEAFSNVTKQVPA